MTQDPVARYKELLGLAHRAGHAHAEQSTKRAAALVEEIFAADKEIQEAEEAEKTATTDVVEWWREVAKSIAGVSWIVSGPRPSPDPRADPDKLWEYIAEVKPATNRFKTALRKAFWLRKPPA